MKFSRFILWLGVVCIFFAAATNAVAAAGGDEWLKVQSKNFQLVGNASEKDLRRVATKFEQFRYVFRQLFSNLNFNSPIPTRVVVFKDEKSFAPFKTREWVAGYFQPGDDTNYIVLSTEGEKEDTYRVIFHEYTHFLIDNTLGRANIPPWFNEGMAEYYEQFQIRDDQRVTLGSLNNDHLLLLQKNKMIPFDVFFNIDYYSLRRQTKLSSGVFYAQSWALMHYLIQGNNGAKNPQLMQFLGLLLRGQTPKSAFQESFQMDYASMEAELKKYIEQSKFTTTIAAFKEKLVFDRELQTFPLGESDALAFQGDLFYHTNRLAEAEKLLAEALVLNPDSTIANTALGLVKMRRKDFVGARRYLEKAIRTDARNYLAHYGYAFVLSREGMTDFGFVSGYSAELADKMRASLRTAISLNPNFAESYNLYSFINIIRNEDIDESIAMIQKALSIAPGNQWYGIRLAELYMRKQDFDNARRTAQKIMLTASDDGLRVYAGNTLKTIDSFEAQLNEIKNYNKRVESEMVSEEPLSEEEITRRRNLALVESLNAALRAPLAGEKRILGFVTKIDCLPREIVVSVKTADRLWQLRSDSITNLTLVAFDNDFANAEFGCGTLKKEGFAVVTYRPSGNPKLKTSGEILMIEFVPKYFKFLEANK